MLREQFASNRQLKRMDLKRKQGCYYFCFDFAVQIEQSRPECVSSLLLIVISGNEKVPEEIMQELREPEKAVSECKPPLCNITNMV